MRSLNFETEKMQCYIRSDQVKILEKIKYEGRIEKDMKIPKTEIIRTALDNLFKLNINEILNLVELNKDIDN
ncbi:MULTISPECIES: hypothetical protein [Methanobacterium]|jgi:hypothetical protein|uniref:Uncharacterized protein n=1 Tax=Methanobacterium veterum TaxID=408577 RepID=A0A9E5A1X7_9EURY|nr:MULTISPECIES: hypothetical protein [Methanobacterium]MCZ3365399.1 hypothetical protein [Methanobacterium veterum]MCZ3373150.1 hypothetical protein [Methanobacterium veterum]